MGQIPTHSIVSGIIVRRIYRSPMRVIFGIVIEKLVLVGAVTCAAVWTAKQVSTNGLVATNVGGQHEWAGGGGVLMSVVKGCLSCGRSPEWHWLKMLELTRVEPRVEHCEGRIQRIGELVNG